MPVCTQRPDRAGQCHAHVCSDLAPNMWELISLDKTMQRTRLMSLRWWHRQIHWNHRHLWPMKCSAAILFAGTRQYTTRYPSSVSPSTWTSSPSAEILSTDSKWESCSIQRTSPRKPSQKPYTRFLVTQNTRPMQWKPNLFWGTSLWNLVICSSTGWTTQSGTRGPNTWWLQLRLSLTSSNISRWMSLPSSHCLRFSLSLYVWNVCAGSAVGKRPLMATVRRKRSDWTLGKVLPRKYVTSHSLWFQKNSCFHVGLIQIQSGSYVCRFIRAMKVRSDSTRPDGLSPAATSTGSSEVFESEEGILLDTSVWLTRQSQFFANCVLVSKTDNAQESHFYCPKWAKTSR